MARPIDSPSLPSILFQHLSEVPPPFLLLFFPRSSSCPIAISHLRRRWWPPAEVQSPAFLPLDRHLVLPEKAKRKG